MFRCNHHQIYIKTAPTCFGAITIKFTLKQLPHVSVQSPSSGSALYELAKVTNVKTVN